MSKASRRAARERLRQERLKEQQRAKRNRILAVIGAAALVVLLVVGVGYFILTADSGPETEQSELYAGLPPQSVQQDGSVVVAEEGTEAPVVEVYVDYQCPACQQFEEESGAVLQEMAGDGEAIVHYRPVSIFAPRGEPVGSNSLRAGAAARAAADHGKFVEYNDVLFENQPAENEVGYEAGDLKEWGAQVGIEDPAFAERIDRESEIAGRFSDYYQQLTSAAQEEMSEERLRTMTLPELVEWGSEQGIDDSFLEGSYAEEVLDATNEAYARYDGENAFEATPSIYLNDEILGNEAFSAQRLREAVEGAGPGEVTTEPLASGEETEPEKAPSVGESPGTEE
ncbi:DsbA family protein [Allosalinactinospora lopnorensis]|uniref:DsbA family protein n=1 Tax=Allosalinactinospora lopnorensis TaxID=1352348 RepID=UPI000623C52A|nr:thioredoxin domain-containing protein [Allosalinactinospora lopnorensis]